MVMSHVRMKKMLVILVMFGMVLGMNTPLWAENGAKIDINTASAEELVTLKNVGAKTAERIIAYRQANGPFTAVEELANVKGIGAKTLERNQDRLMVSGN